MLDVATMVGRETVGGTKTAMVVLFNPICRGIAEKVMATRSSTLAWQIPWTEEPGRLQRSSAKHPQTGLKSLELLPGSADLPHNSSAAAATAVKSLQSCPTLCDPCGVTRSQT